MAIPEREQIYPEACFAADAQRPFPVEMAGPVRRRRVPATLVSLSGLQPDTLLQEI